MNDKKIGKHLRLFLAAHLWMILLFLAAPVALPVFYLVVVEPSAKPAALYYCFLALFVLLCFLLYRLYATWNLYELFCSEHTEMEDFLLHAPKGREERQYQQLMLAFYRRYLAKLRQLEDGKSQNKLMIYRWVHQLKTPLSVIQLIAQKNGYQSDYKKISQAASQIQYDLDQVLNLYKLDAMEKDFHVERISLRQIAKDSINELKSSFIASGIFPKLDADEQLIVYSDSKWLRFVVHQLLTNALKYSDEGKTIAVRAYCTQTAVVLSVEDEGCGIQPEDIPRIFDLFFTGQNGRLRGESTGLGLYMVKQILDYLGHAIQVDSAVGSGTKFQIFFKQTQIDDTRKMTKL